MVFSKTEGIGGKGKVYQSRVCHIVAGQSPSNGGLLGPLLMSDWRENPALKMVWMSVILTPCFLW